MTTFVLGRSAHVEDLKIRAGINETFQVGHADLRNDRNFKSNFFPRVYSAGEMTLDVLEADAGQAHARFFSLVFGPSQKHDGRTHWNQGAGPRCELSAQSNVHRSRHMTRSKFVSRSHVQDDASVLG